VELYNAVLQRQPNHPIAKKRLNKLQKELPRDQSAQEQTTQPSQVQIDALVNLYQTGQMAKAELACGKLLKSYPQSLAVINILGATLQGQGKLQEAVASFGQAGRRGFSDCAQGGRFGRGLRATFVDEPICRAGALGRFTRAGCCRT
jgi:predicted Zn-dependent protease